MFIHVSIASSMNRLPFPQKFCSCVRSRACVCVCVCVCARACKHVNILNALCVISHLLCLHYKKTCQTESTRDVSILNSSKTKSPLVKIQTNVKSAFWKHVQRSKVQIISTSGFKTKRLTSFRFLHIPSDVTCIPEL